MFKQYKNEKGPTLAEPFPTLKQKFTNQNHNMF